MQRVRKKKKIKSMAYISISMAVFLTLLGIGIYAVAAPNDDMNLTPDSVHIKSGDIENSTLAIGSHLIYIGAMTDEIYQIAYQSASTFSQSDMYYKSELGGGSWYEISSATSVADISSEGTPVADSVVEALSFTHHTKSDGITYDLITGQPVNIFNINNVLNISVNAPCSINREIRIISVYLHAKCCSRVGNHCTNCAKSDDTKLLAKNLCTCKCLLSLLC